MICNIHFMIFTILVKIKWITWPMFAFRISLMIWILYFVLEDFLYWVSACGKCHYIFSFNTFIYIFKEVDYYTGHVIHNSMTLILNCRIAQRHIQSLCVQKTFWCQLHSLLNWALEAIHCVKIPLNFFYVVITYFN